MVGGKKTYTRTVNKKETAISEIIEGSKFTKL
jgi:hypothetical protein